MDKKNDFIVIIPAYNEEDTIEDVVLRAKQYADVCVINDNSRDATPEILRRIPDIHVIHHERNTHIPGALLDGMRYAVEQGYRYAIAMDAGLSHNPDEIQRFVDFPHCDLLCGVRRHKVNTPMFRRILSVVGNLIYNICLNFPYSLIKKRYYKDITSGFRRYSYAAMKLLISKNIQSRSFDVLIETAMYIFKNKLIIEEVPITYTFSNSSLNLRVVRDCTSMSMKLIVMPRK
jgi:dolichol-phosphate mannosyltransferase